MVNYHLNFVWKLFKSKKIIQTIVRLIARITIKKYLDWENTWNLILRKKTILEKCHMKKRMMNRKSNLKIKLTEQFW